MCARGGIGRRAGFRSRSLGVQVQFLSGAPNLGTVAITQLVIVPFSLLKFIITKRFGQMLKHLTKPLVFILFEI